MSEMLIRKRIVFHGRVQGVGFRYQARYAAGLYGVTGWVRNNYDYTVTMEIQGTPEQIDQVIAAIDQSRFIRITHMDVIQLPVKEEHGFRALGY